MRSVSFCCAFHVSNSKIEHWYCGASALNVYFDKIIWWILILFFLRPLWMGHYFRYACMWVFKPNVPVNLNSWPKIYCADCGLNITVGSNISWVFFSRVDIFSIQIYYNRSFILFVRLIFRMDVNVRARPKTFALSSMLTYILTNNISSTNDNTSLEYFRSSFCSLLSVCIDRYFHIIYKKTTVSFTHKLRPKLYLK